MAAQTNHWKLGLFVVTGISLAFTDALEQDPDMLIKGLSKDESP